MLSHHREWVELKLQHAGALSEENIAGVTAMYPHFAPKRGWGPLGFEDVYRLVDEWLLANHRFCAGGESDSCLMSFIGKFDGTAASLPEGWVILHEPEDNDELPAPLCPECDAWWKAEEAARQPKSPFSAVTPERGDPNRPEVVNG